MPRKLAKFPFMSFYRNSTDAANLPPPHFPNLFHLWYIRRRSEYSVYGNSRYKFQSLWFGYHLTMPRAPTSTSSAQAPHCVPLSTRFLPVVDVNGQLYYSSPLPAPVPCPVPGRKADKSSCRRTMAPLHYYDFGIDHVAYNPKK